MVYVHFLYVCVCMCVAGTCITSDDYVIRDIHYNGNEVEERATVITRIAPSFIRYTSKCNLLIENVLMEYQIAAVFASYSTQYCVVIALLSVIHFTSWEQYSCVVCGEQSCEFRQVV